MGLSRRILHLLAQALGMHPGPGERVRFLFQDFPRGGLGMLALLGLLLLFLFGFWSLRGLARDRSRRIRILVGILRGLLLALPLLLLLGPSLVLEKEKTLPGRTFVLVDTSWSMNQRDTGAPAPRGGLLARFLGDGKIDFLGRLAAKNQVRLLAFDRTVRTLARDPRGAWPDLEKPRGKATNLAAALQAVLEGERAGRVAAALVFTDGRWNEGGDPSGPARLLKARRVPLHLVGVGDPQAPPALKISSLEAPERAFLGDPFSLEARLQAPPGGPSKVEAILSDTLPGGKTRRIRALRIDLDDRGRGKAVFRVRPERPGIHTFRILVRPVPTGSALEAEEKVVVEVGTLPARVLLVAGGPTWEYRRLRRLFTRDPTIRLSCWLQSASPGFPQEGNDPLRSLPSGEEDLRPFHAVFLLDPDPGKLNLLFPAALARMVEREGMGLLYQAGEIHSLRFFSTTVRAALTGPLANLLPARPDQSTAELLVGMGRAFSLAWNPLPTSQGLQDRLLALGGSPRETRRLLAALPGFYWNYPFHAPAPGAHVLLETPGSDPLRRSPEGPRPLLAWRYAGSGRAVLLATDETWRWAGASEKTWERFWIRTARFLAEPRLLGDPTVHRLSTDKNVYEAGSEVLLFDRPPKGTQPDKVEVLLKAPGGKEIPLVLRPDPSGGGDLSKRFTVSEPGLYEVRLPGEAKARAARFTVRPPALESYGPMAHRSLRDLARLAGGTFRTLKEAAVLPDLVEEASETIVTQSPPRPLWDNWAFLILVVSLLALEWILRKWMNLP